MGAPELLTVPEVAAAARMMRIMVHRCIRAGKLSACALTMTGLVVSSFSAAMVSVVSFSGN
jgi:hypothetical protein